MKATITKKKIKQVITQSIEESTINIATARKCDIIVNTVYNGDGDYKFKQIKRNGYILDAGNETKTEVFSTTELT